MHGQAQAHQRNTLPLRYLALALLAHALLLLLPVLRGTPAPPRERTELQLELLPPRVATTPAAEQSQPGPETVASDPVPKSSLPAVTPAMGTVQAATAIDRLAPEPPMPTARQIIQSLERLGREPEDPPQALPARPTRSPVYETMSRPLLASRANSFDHMAAPARTEIVDRWLSPEGVHQVVVRGINGRTYCGRQEAVDPFRPWTQIPMLFHECAGGGKR